MGAVLDDGSVTRVVGSGTAKGLKFVAVIGWVSVVGRAVMVLRWMMGVLVMMLVAVFARHGVVLVVGGHDVAFAQYSFTAKDVQLVLFPLRSGCKQCTGCILW